MAEWEDYYKVLEVEPGASLAEVKSAYRAKALAFHPDRLIGVDEEEKRAAEEKLKTVNRANAVLSDPEARKKYHVQWLGRHKPPIPSVDRTRLRFTDIEAGKRRTGSFTLTNEGGPYASIRIGNPDSWVIVVGYQSLTDVDELPLRIEIEAVGKDPSSRYFEIITVGLDDQEVQIPVELTTNAAARRDTETETIHVDAGAGSDSIRSRVKSPTRPGYSDEPPRFVTYGITGLTRGMTWVGMVGMVVTGLFGGIGTAQSLPAGTSIVAVPMIGALFAVLGAIGGGIAGAVGGAVVGMIYGAVTKSE